MIYETNLYQSYNTGRYKQMQEVKKTRPYWRYVHNSDENPRKEHLAWAGTTLKADDPWWDTHYPQNGWGCKCSVETLSARDMDGRKLDKAPPLDFQDKTIGERSGNPRNVRVPKGIDPGFAYNPGKAAWGQDMADNVMANWEGLDSNEKWLPLSDSGWHDAGAAKNLKPNTMPAKITRLESESSVLSYLNKKYKTEADRTFDVGGLPVLMNNKSLAHHIAYKKDFGRTEYFSLLDDSLRDPQEVWLGFFRHSATGKIALRARIIKRYGKKNSFFVVDANKGMLESYTFFVSSSNNYINKKRIGKLFYSKDLGFRRIPRRNPK